MKRFAIILLVLIAATAAGAASQKYYEFPDALRLNDTDRILVFQNSSGSRNLTGANLKKQVLAFPNISGNTRVAGRLMLGGATDDTISTLQVKGPQTITATGANGANVFNVSRDWTSASGTNMIGTFDSYNDSSRITLRRSGGTKSSPSATLSGHQIGNLNGRGYVNSAFTGALAAVVFTAEADFTTTSLPTDIRVFTVAPNTTVGTEKLRITGDGRYRYSNNATPPATATSTGTKGDVILDTTNGYIYMCIATDTWRRVALSSW